MSMETPPESPKNTPTTETASPSPPTPDLGSLLKRIDAASVPMKTLKRTALDRFEDSIGGRENLVDTIALSNLDKKQQHFLAILCDPNRQNQSLTVLARDSGLTPTQVLDLFRNASFAKAHALAMGQLSEALPAVVKDIAEKSVDAKVECPRCFGSGFEREEVECIVCLGKGLIFRESDLDRQKLVLETTGISKPKGGVNVQVNQNVGVAMPTNMFSKYVRASDDTAYDVGEIVEAEVKS